MSLILSGTDGLSDIDGSAATPAIRGTDANTGIFFPAADTIAFAEGGVEVARFDSSGNFGIGTASPTANRRLDAVLNANASTGIRVANNDAGSATSTNTTYSNGTTTAEFGMLGTGYGTYGVLTAGNGYIYVGSNKALQLSSDGGFIAFGTGSTGAERARIDSSGNLLVGTTSVPSPVANYRSLVVGGSTGGIVDMGTTSTSYGRVSADSAGLNVESLGATTIIFRTNSAERARIDSSGNLLVGTTTVNGGEILQLKAGGVQWSTGPNTTNGSFDVLNASGTGVYLTNGGTSWTALSDETMKDIIEPIENASQKISTLRTVIGKYKTDEEGTRRAFLIAQDVKEVLPEAVNENENGKLGLQYTDVMPLLVAAIKEQQALITQLTARITALESA